MVRAARRAHDARMVTSMTTVPDDVRTHLAGTTLPPALVDDLLAAAPPVWLASAPPAVLAADLALVHPALGDGEVRAVARPLGGGRQRLTVVARDRVGLLADTAAAITAAGLEVVGASAATWLGDDLALHALTIDGTGSWDELGARLRDVGRGRRPAVRHRPTGAAGVSVVVAPDGTATVAVDAPDAPGLFAAACVALADAGITISAVHAETVDGRAHDVFLTSAAPDPAALGARLSPAPAGVDVGALLLLPARLAAHVVRAVWRTARAEAATPRPAPAVDRAPAP
jgi:glycine cleavage system regulatory protein